MIMEIASVMGEKQETEGVKLGRIALTSAKEIFSNTTHTIMSMARCTEQRNYCVSTHIPHAQLNLERVHFDAPEYLNIVILCVCTFLNTNMHRVSFKNNKSDNTMCTQNTG